MAQGLQAWPGGEPSQPSQPHPCPSSSRAKDSLARKGQQGADWKSAFQTGSLSVFLPVLVCSVDARHQHPPPAPGDALWGAGAPLCPEVQETGLSHRRLISNKRQDPQRAGVGRTVAEQGRPVGTWSACHHQLPVQPGSGLACRDPSPPREVLSGSTLPLLPDI